MSTAPEMIPTPKWTPTKWSPKLNPKWSPSNCLNGIAYGTLSCRKAYLLFFQGYSKMLTFFTFLLASLVFPHMFLCFLSSLNTLNKIKIYNKNRKLRKWIESCVQLQNQPSILNSKVRMLIVRIWSTRNSEWFNNPYFNYVWTEQFSLSLWIFLSRWKVLQKESQNNGVVL